MAAINRISTHLQGKPGLKKGLVSTTEVHTTKSWCKWMVILVSVTEERLWQVWLTLLQVTEPSLHHTFCSAFTSSFKCLKELYYIVVLHKVLFLESEGKEKQSRCETNAIDLMQPTATLPAHRYRIQSMRIFLRIYVYVHFTFSAAKVLVIPTKRQELSGHDWPFCVPQLTWSPADSCSPRKMPGSLYTGQIRLCVVQNLNTYWPLVGCVVTSFTLASPVSHSCGNRTIKLQVWG